MAPSPSFVSGAYRRTLVLGVLGAAFGAVLGFWIARGAAGHGWDKLGYPAAAAAGLTIMPLWWLVLERPRRFSIARGASVGALAGLLAHYPCWYLAAVGQYVAFRFFGGSPSSTGEPPIGPIEALQGALVLSVWSWLLYGWLTAIIGALSVGTYAGYFRRMQR